MSKTIKPTNIIDLSDDEIRLMKTIYDTVPCQFMASKEVGFIRDPINYKNLVEEMKKPNEKGDIKNLGRVFFEKNEEEEIVGFLLSFDSLNLKNSHDFPSSFIARYLSHEWRFIKDLSQIGDFCFMSQIIVKSDCIAKGTGKLLLKQYLTYYSSPQKSIKEKKHKSPILSGGVLHEQQFKMIKWLSKPEFEVLFIDYYFVDKSNKELWFRTIKIMNLEAFYSKIRLDIIEKVFRTIIPIQLNLTTRSLNNLLAPLGAKVIWSSFFQHEAPYLSKEIHLDKFYTGFYEPILASGKENHEKNINALKEIVKYLQKKDKPEYSKVASLSSILKRGGFNFFLIDDKPEHHSFPDFANPITVDLRKLEVIDLLKNKPLRIGQIDNKNAFKWNKYIREKIGKGDKNSLSESELKEVTEWRKNKLISEQEWNDLKIIVENWQTGKATDFGKEDKEYLEEVKGRRMIDEQDAQMWQEWIDLHKTMYETDKYCMNPNDKWCHAVIPISFVEGLNGVMFTLVFESTNQDKEWLNHLALNVANSLSKNMFNIIVRLQKAKMQRMLMKHAISSISTRNLSHHFGSHILSKLSFEDNLKKFIINNGNDFKVKSISNFFVYLRTRMDFLADISTSEPVTSVARFLNSDVLEVFRNEEIVRTYISGSKIEEITINYINEIDKDKDIQIQLPNGNLGAHAIYLIFENLIRNTIKHSQTEFADNRLELSVKIMKDINVIHSSRGYTVRVHDNVLKPKKEINNLIQKIQKNFIDAPIIQSNKKIRSVGWGIGEIKMATSYLRKKMPSEFLDKKNLTPPLLKAIFEESESKKDHGYLGFEFYLKKPRKIIIIESNGVLLQFSNRKDWQNEGIKILSQADLKEERKQIHSHEIILLFDDKERASIEKAKNYPLRWIYIKDKAQQYKIKKWLEDDINKAFVKIWKLWIEVYLNNKEKKSEYYPVLRSDSDGVINLKPKKNYFETKPLPQIILFDLHGDAVKNNLVKPHELEFYEAFGNSSPIGYLLHDYKSLSDNEKKCLHWELIEAACTNIIIIDERIQAELSNAPPKVDVLSEDSFQVLEWMNIFVPKVEQVNLYVDKFSVVVEQSLKDWIDVQMSKCKVDFVIIHLGIIEKLVGTHLQHIQDFIQEYIHKHDVRPEIIITSGRGKPHELPAKALFLNYSNLTKYLLEERSKFHFCKLLFSARTRLEGYDI